MHEAAHLRQLAAQCREMAAGLHARRTAETLLDMARHFEESAALAEQPPEPRAPAAARN